MVVRKQRPNKYYNVFHYNREFVKSLSHGDLPQTYARHDRGGLWRADQRLSKLFKNIQLQLNREYQQNNNRVISLEKIMDNLDLSPILDTIEDT